MEPIFTYLDYREYLENFFAEKKLANPHFSYQVLATQAGFKSKSYIKMVIDGQKNLSEESILLLNRVLKLNEKSLAYFKDLVAFNQAKKLQMRNFYFEKLMEYQKRSTARLLLQNQYDLLSHWYHGAIREIVTRFNFHGDYALLGSMVKPAISSRKAREAVKVLLRLGLIRKNGDTYEQTELTLTTGDEVRSIAVQNFHIQNCLLAGQSIDTCPSPERDISSIIACLSDAGFATIKSEIQTFRKRLLKIIGNDQPGKRVYHINFQLFPTSENFDEKE
jgi:uncharacterized protein (TIGR02147 family)